MLTVVCSAKGSPGVTSSALVLVATWPRPVLLVEADPAGADLPARLADGWDPTGPGAGLIGLAADLRAGRPSAASLRAGAGQLRGGLPVITGPATPRQASGIDPVADPIASALRESDDDVVVDVGRLTESSRMTTALVADADLVVLVMTAALESVLHARDLLRDGALGPTSNGPAVVPLVVTPATSAGRTCADVDAVLRPAATARAATFLPPDRRVLAHLERGVAPAGRLVRTELLRRARAVADELVEGTRPGRAPSPPQASRWQAGPAGARQ